MIHVFRTVRRPAITLLELLVVISILTIMTGVIGINVTKAIREQQFRSEVARVADQLRLAQDLMLIMDVGVTVTFETAPEGDGIVYRLDTDLPLPPQWNALVKAPQPKLKAIHWFQIEGVEKEGSMNIKFLSEEAGMTKGVLRLSTSRSDEDFGALTSYICLPGYPQPIVVEKKDPHCELEKEGDFVKNLAKYTYEEISEIKNAK
ncbi:MAG: type II secretion system protein [Chlamydiota bacterium]|nr:type II secretion system protein [Chlamydiota bacterium]